MFDVLVVSRPSHWRTPRWAMGSLCIHALLLGVVVATTRGSLDTLRRPIADTTLVFLRRLQPPVTTPEPPPEDQDRVVRPTSSRCLRPPRGFKPSCRRKTSPPLSPPST
jgi:hypothetical protein